MKQAHSTKFLAILGLGLSSQRVSRLKEEYLGDADVDKSAKRTAIKRVLQSYLAMSNLNSLVVFLVAGLGIIASLFYLFIIRERFGKQGRIWGICCALLSIDIMVASTTGDYLSFQLVNCFFSLMIALIAGGLRSSAP